MRWGFIMYSTSQSILHARRNLAGVLMIVVAALTGGGDVAGSKDVATSEMYADLNAWSFGESIILVTANLKKGTSSSDTYVKLEDGDRLVVSLNQPLDAAGGNGDLFDQVDAATTAHKVMDGGPEVETGIPFPFLNVFPFLNDFAAPYRARFDTAKVGDTFIIALERTDYNSAPNSSVALPESFAVTAPASGGTVVRSAALDINWSPVQVTAQVKVTANMTCPAEIIDTWSAAPTADTGTITIPAGVFTNASGTCDLVITIDRYLQGVVDPNYGQGGTIRAHQFRFVKVKSNP